MFECVLNVWVVIRSVDDTWGDVIADELCLMAIFEATVEVAAMATRCLSASLDCASQRQRQFVSLGKNTDSPSHCCDPLASIPHLPV